MATYNKDFIKENLTMTDIYEIVTELGGEPVQHNDFITARTICHCGDSHKLYYYSNTHLFRCFTGCADSTFDIFELVRKVKGRQENGWHLPKAIEYVAVRFGFDSINQDFENEGEILPDWEIFNKFSKTNELKDKQIVELKTFDGKFLNHLPRPRIPIWLNEGISQTVMNHRGICYDPYSHGIVIPHYDIDGNLIGIRERTLVQEDEVYGKYRPAVINGTMYNHPLGFNLYNINWSKNNIQHLKKAIIYEGEKSTLLHASYFGEDSDISVAVCGSNLINYQFQLLRSLGVQEICIAFDRQYKDVGDAEWKLWTKKLTELHNKYSNYCEVSFIFDKENILGYKMSPIDAGPNVFMDLFNRRIQV